MKKAVRGSACLAFTVLCIALAFFISTGRIVQAGTFPFVQLVDSNGYQAQLTAGGAQIVHNDGSFTGGGGGTTSKTILTSSSATACTSIVAGASHTAVAIINTGAAQSVYLQLYDEGASPACVATDDIYGNGTTLALGIGQVVTLNIPLTSGLAYKLSGALGANVVVTNM